MKKNIAIILAGGQGTRFDNEVSKALVKIAGAPVILHTLKKFETHKQIHEIILVAHKDTVRDFEDLLETAEISKIVRIVPGGATRQESSYAGIEASSAGNPDNVLFHDAVRPFVSHQIITDVIDALNTHVAVDVAIASPDTLIEINEENTITRIPQRSFLRRGQTPQGFRFDIIRQAHILARENKYKDTTDDCGLILKYGLGTIAVVAGAEENIKITYPLDIHIADKIFQINNLVIENRVLQKEDVLGKNVLVFGHSSGIGAEIYALCAENGARVHGMSLSSGVDITDYPAVQRHIREFANTNGDIDILISTVGVLHREMLVDMLPERLRQDIEVNYTAQALLVKYALPYMRKGGSIALFGSSSYTRGRSTYAVYSSTKAAIVNLVQAVSEEVISMGININVICPARTNTPMRKQNFGDEDPESLLDPRYVAETTLVVCTSDITGQVINISR